MNSFDMNGLGNSVTVLPGANIGATANLMVWDTQNAIFEVDGVVIYFSWYPVPPPSPPPMHYACIYWGIPGTTNYPGVPYTGQVSFASPTTPGQYFVYLSEVAWASNCPQAASTITSYGMNGYLVGTIVVSTGLVLSTALSASLVTAGSSVYDTATLTHATGGAGGTVTYSCYSGYSCSGSATTVSTVTVANGVVPNSASQPFNFAGSYSWQAAYTGDSNNSPATSQCEPLTVNPPSKNSPSISTTLSAQSVVVGGSRFDTAELANSTATAGGAVTYYYSTSNSCPASSPITVNTVTVTSGVVPDSAAITFDTVGTYYWYAVYSGDANNLGSYRTAKLTIEP